MDTNHTEWNQCSATSEKMSGGKPQAHIGDVVITPLPALLRMLLGLSALPRILPPSLPTEDVTQSLCSVEDFTLTSPKTLLLHLLIPPRMTSPPSWLCQGCHRPASWLHWQGRCTSWLWGRHCCSASWHWGWNHYSASWVWWSDCWIAKALSLLYLLNLSYVHLPCSAGDVPLLHCSTEDVALSPCCIVDITPPPYPIEYWQRCHSQDSRPFLGASGVMPSGGARSSNQGQALLDHQRASSLMVLKFFIWYLCSPTLGSPVATLITFCLFVILVLLFGCLLLVCLIKNVCTWIHLLGIFILKC